MLAAARYRADESDVNVRFERAEVSHLPFDEHSFDVVFAVTVLCFVPNAALAIEEMVRVLAPGGNLVLADLNRWSTWAAWRRARGLLGSRTWRQVKFRSAGEIARLASGSGLDVSRITGAIYYPPNRALAPLLASVDRKLSATTTLGAAFIAVAAKKRTSQEAVS
jgi:ubiquinone/menaquinone biosynthesis C-methylase UbiE